MFNVISSELYKLRKSKGFWIMVAVVAAVAVLSSVVFGVLSAEELPGMRPESGSAMLIGALPMNIGSMLWFLVGFVIIFISFDFESGCIRNPLAIGVTRVQYYGAKFIMALLTCFVFVFVTLVGATVPFTIMEGWGNGLDVGAFLASASVGYLILVAQVTLFMSLAMILRKIGPTLGILIGYLVLDMVVSGFMVFAELNDVLRGLANVLPSPAGFYLNGLSTGDAYFGDVMWVVVVSMVVIVVMSALAIRSLTRRDV